MTSTDPIHEGQQVMFAGKRFAIAYINYSPRSHGCSFGYCRSFDLVNGPHLNIRECELTAAPAGMAIGETKTRPAGRVVIALTRTGAVEDLYKVYVAYDRTLREVDGLAFTVDGYDKAATVANNLTDWFRTGVSAQQALDALPALRSLFGLAA